MTESEFVDVLVNGKSRIKDSGRVLLRMVYVDGVARSSAAQLLGMSRQVAYQHCRSFDKLKRLLEAKRNLK